MTAPPSPRRGHPRRDLGRRSRSFADRLPGHRDERPRSARRAAASPQFEGRIEGGEQPSLAGTIRVDSLRTDNEQRDAHLISPDFLDAAKHPEIRFESTAVEPLDAERFSARGNLFVKDTPFEIELEGRIRGQGQGQAGDERIVIDARGAFDWGTTTVEITAAVSAVKEA